MEMMCHSHQDGMRVVFAGNAGMWDNFKRMLYYPHPQEHIQPIQGRIHAPHQSINCVWHATGSD